MAILVHDPEPLTFDIPDQYVFRCFVKSYQHAKFLAFSSKLGFGESIVVELISKHRCRSAQGPTTMLSKFNNDALYSKQSIVVVKIDGPYNSCHYQYGGLQINLNELIML